MAQPIDLCTTKYKHLADLDLADTSSDGASTGLWLLERSAKERLGLWPVGMGLVECGPHA